MELDDILLRAIPGAAAAAAAIYLTKLGRSTSAQPAEWRGDRLILRPARRTIMIGAASLLCGGLVLAFRLTTEGPWLLWMELTVIGAMAFFGLGALYLIVEGLFRRYSADDVELTRRSPFLGNARFLWADLSGIRRSDALGGYRLDFRHSGHMWIPDGMRGGDSLVDYAAYRLKQSG